MSRSVFPRIWLGHNLNNPIPFWNYFDGDYGILLNAYQILKKPRVYRRYVENGLKETLGFNGKIFLDSGGFLFQMNNSLSVKLDEVIEVYNSLRIDVGVVLDYPLNPNITYSGNLKRWNRTLINSEIMLEKFDKVVPVVHGFTPRQVKNRSKQIKEIYGMPEMICIGSMVPFYRSSYIGDYLSNRGLKKWEMIDNLVSVVRSEFPNSHIHAFGSGSVNNIKRLYKNGIDSTDSVYWQVKAGYGEIVVPSGFTRSLNQERKKSQKTKPLQSEGLDFVCDCPVCVNLNGREKIKLLKESYKKRAIHNSFLIYKLTQSY